MVNINKKRNNIYKNAESLSFYCKTIVLKTLICLFEMKRYDFGLNIEMPYINPFRYMSAMKIEVLTLCM
jgi:hypothetical protein